MPSSETETTQAFIQALALLHGEQLSAVTFVQDYMQIHFDSYTINVYNPLQVEKGSITYIKDKAGYRDALCEEISAIVDRVEVIDTEDEEGIKITFANGISFHISLKADDYTGPEALEFHDGDHFWVT